ncbi:carbonic anhydrase [Oceanobacter kriegii]|uniref:carbonic anhydrase n=1 Tax=Oceanobacter kriegii TaxID=64972 RepID=UPI00040650AD|nr:carbonic anhydrase [Oceanobacter kriegii]
MKKLVQGVLNFQKDVHPENKELFDELATGQSPEILFITCSDSRIDPNLVTGSEPGDLFICRNAGNIVPPHAHHTGGMTASIEYAVAVLGVRHIIICGHADCGAIKGALDMSKVEGLPHVHEWLGHCRSAMDIVRERHQIPRTNPIDGCHLNECISENVLQQVQHIRTHPAVASKVATGKVFVHGWVYDIKSGDIQASDEHCTKFLSFDERYKDVIEQL